MPRLVPVEKKPKLVPKNQTSAGEQFVQGARQGVADLTSMASGVVQNQPGVQLAQRALGMAGVDVPTATDLSQQAEPSIAGEQEEPQTFGQKISRYTGEFLPGTVAFGGPAAAGSANVVRRALAEGAALGGSAFGRSVAPDTPTGQIVGTILGGVAPSALSSGISAATKGLLRGPRKGMAENIRAFERAGTTPSVGQTSKASRADFVEQTLGSVPGGQGKMARFGGQQQEAIGRTVQRRADELGPRSSPEVAGRTIEKGLTGKGGFLERFRDTADTEFGKLSRIIPEDQTVTIGNTRGALDDLVGRSEELGDVEKVLSNQTVARLKEAVDEAAPTGEMSFQALQRFRSLVGRKLASASLQDDIPTGQLKQLYGSLSDDIAEAAEKSGPQASRQFRRANDYYKAGIGRIEDIVEKVSKKATPEEIFRFATQGTKEGGTRIRQVMRSLKPEERKVVASSVMRRMGRANPSQQDELGEVFSTETFLTNWNRMSGDAKKALFSGKEMGDLKGDLDNIAKVSSRIRESAQTLANPSGTAQRGANILTLGAIAGSGGMAGAGMGNAALVVPVAVGGILAGARGGAQLMTSPKFVKWLSKGSQMSAKQIPAHVARLGQVLKDEDPEVKEAARNYLEALDGLSGLTTGSQAPQGQPTQ